MRRIVGPTVMAALTVATLCFIPGGTAAAKNTQSVVPSGWRTYGYKDLLISVPASWPVIKHVVGPCFLGPYSGREGALVLGVSAFSECAAFSPPHNVLWVLDVPRGDYGPRGPAPYYYPRTATNVNGINVYVAVSTKAGLAGGTPITGPRRPVTAYLEWYTPGAEEIRGFGPEVSRVAHTIRRA
jgi:hypothetical protein